MAMVLDAFASYLGNLLAQMVKDEVGILLGVSDEIKKMEAMLHDIENILADAEKKRITNKAVAGWVRELKDVMYDASDILDICQLKAEERPEMGSHCCNSLLFCLRDPPFAHKIGTQIKALNQKLEDISKRSGRFNFNLASPEHHTNTGASHHHVSREMGSVFIEGDIVGEKIEQDTRMLVEMLTKKEEATRRMTRGNTMVIAIVGVGGIGKTTLVKKIFNDEVIHAKFDKKIWLSVTQDFKEIDLLKNIITGLGSNHVAHLGDNKAQLEQALMSAVNQKKFLLVMDDMWSDKAWNELLRAPLIRASAHGSRILVTTRDEGVARQMMAIYFHHVDKLGSEDAWALLKKQVSPTERDELEVESLRETGMKIIEKCDGLPLAIKVIGGLLCKKNRNKGVWEEVSKDPAWSNTGLPEELNNAVYLSYEYLSSPLKQCFIYYSLFPKDEVMFREQVISMWIAEGFVRDDGSLKQLEVLGIEYYNELVMRNLLEPNIEYYDQCYCIMHDVVRSFALHVATDEALVVREGQSISIIASSKYRRLSLSNEIVEWSTLQKQESLRTLILFGDVNVKPGDSLSTLSCLRVLHVENDDFTTLLGFMCHLKHLRYLALNETDISKLPDDIGKVKFLQYISVYGCQNLVRLPRSITKLERLRFLDIRKTRINAISKGFGRLKNLVMLYGFPVHIDDNVTDWCSLEEIGSLSQLMTLSLKGLENVPRRSMATCANLGSKMHLTDLRLDYNSSRMTTDGAHQQCIEEVLDELCPPPCLKKLTIKRYFGCRVPRWMMSTGMLLFGNLRRLKLRDLTCCMHLPDGLAQLPNLDYLDITNAPCIQHIGHEFLFLPFSSCSSSLLGSGMNKEKRIDISTSSGGMRRDINNKNRISQATSSAFPRLRKLFLFGMVEWKEWDWEEQVQAMPSLQLLDIRDCKLRLLPPGLPYQARDLKELYIVHVNHLSSIENFLHSVVVLHVNFNLDLERIINLPRMQTLTIWGCPKLKELEGVEALRSIELRDYKMETLPRYLQDARQVTKLEIHCSLELLKAISMRDIGSEWDKINHVQQLKAYSLEGDEERRWYFLYTREPYNVFFDTNINSTSI